jgi:hypothetical protein
MQIDTYMPTSKYSETIAIAATFLIFGIGGLLIVSQFFVVLFAIWSTLAWVEMPDLIYLGTLFILIIPSALFLAKDKKPILFVAAVILISFIVYLIRWENNFVTNRQRVPIDIFCFSCSFLIVAIKLAQLKYIKDEE